MTASAIVYTSATGFTARYAQLLSRKTGLPCLALERAKEPVGFYDDVELVPVVGGASEHGLHVEAMGAGDTLVVAVAIITVYLKDG